MTRPDIPVTIGGDPRGFESALSRVRNAARSTAGDVSAAFARIKSIGAGAIGIAGAVGLTTFVQAAKSAADAVANIGDEARRAGLSAKVFQEWKYVAEQARIPVDAITDGLKELQLRADEFAVTGKGSAAEAFERLGLTPQEVKERLKNPSELLLLLIERTRQLKDTAAGIRVFDELFGGTGGERMVALIEQGEAGIRSQIAAANDFGNVLSDDIILKAQEIDRQFNTISTTVGNSLKAAIVSVVSSMSEFIDKFNAIEDQKNSTIDNRVAQLGMERLDVENKILAAKERQAELSRAGMSNPLSQGVDKSDLDAYQRQLAGIAAEEERLVKERGKRIQSGPTGAGATWTPPAYAPPPPSGGSKKSSGGPKLNEYERETQLIQKRTEALNATTSAQASVNPLINDYGYAVEYAAAKQELLTAAQEAGVKITPELTQSIEGLASGYANAVVAAEQLSEKQDEIRQRAEDAMATAKDVTRGIIDGFIDGAKAADILTGSLKKIGNALIDDVLGSIFKVGSASGGGGGILSSIFGGLFGGGKKSFFPAAPLPMYAKGTNSARAGLAIVGEDGPEVVNFGGGEKVIPNHRLSSVFNPPVTQQAAQSAGSINVDARTIIQASGNAETDAKLMAWAGEQNASLPQRVVDIVKDAQRRRIL